ncbi:MAG: hypothetical protein ABUK01_06590 [Leptospirales bacterium]
MSQKEDLTGPNREISQIKYPKNIQSIRTVLQGQFTKKIQAKRGSPVIVSGHQVGVFHPGILAKEVLAGKLAKEQNGIAITLVLDHDPTHVYFNYPDWNLKMDHHRLVKKDCHLGDIFLKKKGLARIHSERWQSHLIELSKNCEHYLNRETTENARQSIETLLDNRNKYDNLIDYLVFSRMQDLQKEKIEIFPVRTSDLIATPEWKNFANDIYENGSRFREIYNRALSMYRTEHGIINHAQPVPDLHEEELPFWIYTNPELESREKAYKNNFDAQKALPRAITLSLFVRLYLSDIFIHGTGGARYDVVTNQIMHEYFNVSISPYMVETRTLQIPLLKDSTLNEIKMLPTLSNWTTEYRRFQFHPERSLNKNHPYRQKRAELIKEFKVQKGAKKKIHDELEKNRKTILNDLKHENETRLATRSKILEYEKDREALYNRTFPYFFYDWR